MKYKNSRSGSQEHAPETRPELNPYDPTLFFRDHFDTIWPKLRYKFPPSGAIYPAHAIFHEQV
jgi:hypothetical protein